jgi:hypothetical protein
MGAYNLRQFNREPFGEKSLLDAARRLEDEAAIRPLVKLPE